MSFAQTVQRVASALEDSEIPYMFTGSFASTFHGAARSTIDLDVVIAASAQQLESLLDLLAKREFYVDRMGAAQAFKHGSMFNAVDWKTSLKIDFIMRKSRAFSMEEFARRSPVQFEGKSVFVTTAEDAIISKLEWAKIGGSRRQIEDVRGLFQFRKETLDRAHIEKWVMSLGLREQWNDALGRRDARNTGADDRT
jgi:hypothetical protein